MTLLIIKFKSREDRLKIQFLLMLHHRFANATQVLLGGQKKLESMKKGSLKTTSP
jgi:hypothetical protein